MIKGQLLRMGNGSWIIVELKKQPEAMARQSYPFKPGSLPDSEKQYLVNGNSVLFETVRSKKDGKTYAKIRKWVGTPSKVNAASHLKFNKTGSLDLTIGTAQPNQKLHVVDLDKKHESKSFTVTAGY